MWHALKLLKDAHPQTKFFIFTVVLYMAALFWTTLQAYARLEYSRTGISKPIVINTKSYDQS